MSEHDWYLDAEFSTRLPTDELSAECRRFYGSEQSGVDFAQSLAAFIVVPECADVLRRALEGSRLGVADDEASNTDDEMAFLRDWAARHKVIFDDEGECGIGRECVGITAGSAWVDLGPSTHVDSPYGGYDEQDIDDRCRAPIGVEDAYHKHDCLAVLGRGPEAIHQLYLWVKNLADHGVTIGRSPRTPTNATDLLFHGIEYVLQAPGQKVTDD